MRRSLMVGGGSVVGAAVLVLVLAVTSSPSAAAAAQPGMSGPSVGSVTMVSRACSGQNAEVEQAVDPALGYVYEAWMGCKGIAFARSTDGGRHFGLPVSVPESVYASSWDPALAVAYDGTVYASFMTSKNGYTYPVVAASFNHGRTFPQVSTLRPPYRGNWGDRVFIAAGRHGTLYVSWDYGPSAAAVTYICTPGGSCAFATGDLNVVIQKSTDGGKTWGAITPVSPGFPASGGDSAPLLVEPNGRIDVEYQGYHITNDVTYTMNPANSYFTSSVDGGKSWSAPVMIGPRRLTMSLGEWWIDGALGRDAAGNLYATWDTQTANSDIGWLSYSTDHGRTWSPLQRVTPDSGKATHIVEVAGGSAGVAYVGWLSDSSARGYAQYLRPFSIDKGWLSPPLQVSKQFGKRSVWPGDTFGISTLASPGRVVLSWGSAIKNRTSQIFAATVVLHPGRG